MRTVSGCGAESYNGFWMKNNIKRIQPIRHPRPMRPIHEPMYEPDYSFVSSLRLAHSRGGEKIILHTPIVNQPRDGAAGSAEGAGAGVRKYF